LCAVQVRAPAQEGPELTLFIQLDDRAARSCAGRFSPIRAALASPFSENFTDALKRRAPSSAAHLQILKDMDRTLCGFAFQSTGRLDFI
jgi:hypothetical protein